MAGAVGRSARDLIEELAAGGHRFDFFQAVRLLALAARHGSKPETAHATPQSLRFRTPLSLAFPASEVLDIEAGAADGNDPSLRMTVGFMGLTGPSGVLPTAYTELFIDRRYQYRDTAAHDFLDLFSHRAISLFYQAWRKHRFYLAFEAGDRDGFTRNVLDLAGAGLGALQSRREHDGNGIPDIFLAHFSGLLAQKPMSAANLAALVRGYFRVEANVEQFVGQWIAVPAHEQSRLGVQACTLGESAFIGERAWDRQNKICIRLGPLRRATFMDFLPGRPGAVALARLVHFCVGHAFACEVELALERHDVPHMRLDSSGECAPILGHLSWLHTRSCPADARDVRFTLVE